MSLLPASRKERRHIGINLKRLSALALLMSLLALAVATTESNSKSTASETATHTGSSVVNNHPSAAVELGDQKTRIADRFWNERTEADLPAETKASQRMPKEYRVLELDLSEFERKLEEAPMEFTPEAIKKDVVISLPVPDGRLWRIRVQRSPILSDELASKFPEIRTYSGQGIDEPNATMRLSWTTKGLNAFVISEEGSFMVVPYSEASSRYYLSFFTRDAEGASLECLMPGSQTSEADSLQSPDSYRGASLVIANGTLREYRMAISVTQQFYQRFGGPFISPQFDPGVVAAITVYINNVNAIYEREVSTRFRFVNWIADRPGLCFPTANCFPPDQNAQQMMAPNQYILDNIFGAGAYHIGAALGYSFDQLPFGYASFGSAGIGGACENSFKGQTGARLIGSVGDYMSSLVLAHEWGHMFGARHTFSSGFCPGGQLGPLEDRIEPGSGSTIMSYAPICSPENLFTGNPSSGADNYFHIHSLIKISNHKSVYSSCGQPIATGNGPPAILDGGAPATIPAFTPFTLTASASDPNGHPLTYTWEEWDPALTLFRSHPPTSSPSRTFPSLTYILQNGNVPPTVVNGFFSGESLPSTTRTLNFTVTVRDNRAGGGGTSARDALLPINVVSSAGPFTVTHPSTPATLPRGGQTTITWNVAGTNLSPISTTQVRILLSVDGGNTFPTVLANGTPNDGAEVVTLPDSQTSTARIKVEAVGNIYFDISNSNFSIVDTVNLTPFQPTGWSDKIVVSSVSGTNTDSAPLRSTDSLRLDWAVINNGGTATNSIFHTKLFVDGVERQSWFTNPPLNPNAYTHVEDYVLGPLSVGTHTLRILTDVNSTITENNESDNEYTRTINVTAPGSSVQFSGAAISANEGGGSVSINLTRSGDSSGLASINYATSDPAGLNSCNLFNGIASSRCDYATSIGMVRFEPGQTSKTISIPLVNDSYAEGNENFNITLSNASGASLGTPATVVVTINDNDLTTGTNPVAQTAFFVRQHYIDFLGREPDPVSFQNWQNTINNCPAGNTTCDRIHVSGNFFQSSEFQQRGYFVYRFYPVSFRRKPDYSEFIPDLARVSGFLNDSQLEAAKIAFINDFMARPAFVTSYNGLNHTQYVDTLLSTAGITHVARDFWIAALGNGTRTRAQVLREISESNEVYNKYYNQAFVVMQYFGYLRRDPDALYLNWIQDLDTSGDFRRMVSNFMNSLEYRFRFGP